VDWRFSIFSVEMVSGSDRSDCMFIHFILRVANAALHSALHSPFIVIVIAISRYLSTRTISVQYHMIQLKTMDSLLLIFTLISFET
jgi:hypothetical protein